MKNTQKHCSSTDEVVDLEMNCLICRTHLYVPVPIAGYVVAVVEGGGTDFLRCYCCGQVQSVRQKRRKTYD